MNMNDIGHPFCSFFDTSLFSLIRRFRIAIWRFCLTIGFILLAFSNAIAQSNIPKLTAQLSAPTADSCQLFCELGKAYPDVNIDSSFYFLHASLDIARRKNNPQAIAEAMYYLGRNYAIYVRNDAKAIEWLNKAIVVAKASNDNLNLARSYQYLGLLAYYQSSKNVYELLDKALSYAKISNDWQVISSIYSLIYEYHLKAKKYNEAETAILKAVTTCEPHSPDDWLSYGLDYADLLESQNKKEAAFAFIQKFETVNGKLTKSKGDFVNRIDLARLETKLKHYTKAESLLQNALETEKTKLRPDTNNLMSILRYTMNLYVSEGNVEKTYQTINDLLDIRLATKQKRLTQDSKVKMVEVKSALDLEQKEAEITLLDEQKKRQSLYLIGTIVIAVLLGSFMVILQRNYRRIEQQKAELAELNKTKDRLMSIIAHDLRSPIGLLKDSFERMDNGIQSPEQTARFLSKSRERIDRVYNAMENLLVWALAQRHGLNPKFESVSLADSMAEQIEAVQDFAAKKEITIKNETPQYLNVWADKNQLAIVLNNLLQNALKFTPSGGTITLSAEATDDNNITLKVADTGVGMDTAVWQQQQKAQTLLSKEGTAKEKGTGLGLFLVKEIVDKNAGTLHIESEKGVGTTVSIAFKKPSQN